MQRLYVGGLSHSVTQKDLTDRFGKFGKVEDVELRTRRDDEGVPYKTFAYINLSISTTDLKKCMTVLNKSKWKGGTLQIEPAKESFLHKLAQERQLEQQRPRQDTDNKQQNAPKLLESLSKAGVENFTMKAAVPGTEVPGHKDWVVSKYGRVLPVMQLRRKKGTKTCTIKYDPSKYCHNIRRLDPATAVADPSTPVAQLTWQMNGGDDDISRKRRGEFPPYRPPKPKRTHTDALESIRAANQARPAQVVSCAKLKNHQPMNEFVPANDKRPVQRRERARYEDSDSEEEMRRLVALEQSSRNPPGRHVEDDNLEVVGYDYLVTFGGSRQKYRGGPMNQDEDDYDSADTDELFTSRKRPLPPRENISGERTAAPKRKRKEQDKGTKKTAVLSKEAEEDSTGTEEMAASRKPSLPKKKNILKERTGKAKRETKEDNEGSMEMMTVHSEEDEDKMDSADSDYEAMFANVTRLEISLADLQKLAQENLEKRPPPDAQVSPAHVPKRGTLPEDILAALLGDDGSDDEREARKEKKKGRRVARTSLPPFRGTATLDEDALKKTDVPENTKDKSDGSSFEEEAKAAVDKQEEVSNDSEELPVSRKPSLPPQKNISEERTGTPERKIKDDDERSKEMTVPSEEDEDEVDSDESDDEATFPDVPRLEISLAYLRKKSTHSLEKRAPPNARVTSAPVPKRGMLPEDHLPTCLGDSSSEDEREAKKEEQKGSTVARRRLPPFQGTATLDEGAPKTTGAPENKKGESDGSSSSSEEEAEEAEEAVAAPRPRLSAREEEERQRKDNKRRLAAVERRRKEAEEHKKLIQGALANLDAVTPRTGKHIVFNFDDDDEPTALAADESVPVGHEDRAAASGPRLFGSSEDEDEEDGDEEEDGGRFHIKPQFEGQAGQKLMELQSRFGTDERFRMDSRFLEEEDEEDDKEESDDDGGAEVKTSAAEDEGFLQEEKKRNMSILQGLLGHQANSAKPSAKTKTFRDVSALHYDPSREEHAAFESKVDGNKKSKSARRKKREEAQKLPEVSKEIFYNVSDDLKAKFGPAAVQKPAEQPKASWDEEEEKDEKDEEQPPPEEASGFMFSFFGDDIQTASEHKEYKAESIQAAKVFRWQQDPRLQDSSEDDEDEEEVQQEESSAAPKDTTEEMVSSSNNFFFFRLDDSRLIEGPEWFCRSSQLEEEREEWEERRTELRQEYRKKHKDACRKLKSSQKT
ncbi:nucleolar protein 8 isoform X2 [Hippocampus zosterae]|uniref:nucleolar protein 8 isoform X2 n=1 Tax=Hippocampus zosterae TaxID=109293 RepID=UPI00223E677D|nr:nucleolar protein 8 isoform X2 [Hippocampus zosterae]